jgi:hypothetical protein
MEKKPRVISTQNPQSLPQIELLTQISQSLAVLDAALMPEWEYRTFSYNARWREGETLASMRNGSGDGYLIWFAQAGAVLKGFAHESATWSYLNGEGQGDLAASSLGQQLPSAFESFLREPAFVIKEVTFCLWRQLEAASWEVWQPPVPEELCYNDGSQDLLWMVNGEPRTYQGWAEENYEIKPALATIQRVYAHRPLTERLLKRLGSPRRMGELTEELVVSPVGL